MSGPFGAGSLQFFSGGGAAGFYPVSIDQSLRFNDDDLAYLSRTPASAGDQQTWTWSGWVKLGNIATSKTLFAARTGVSGTYLTVVLSSLGDFRMESNSETAYPLYKTNALFRDPSAWYHFVVSVDMKEELAENRIKTYVNGVLQTTASYNVPTRYTNLNVNSTADHYIGRQAGASYVDGYLAEVHFLNGIAATADDFGELKSGVWVAKAYTGAYDSAAQISAGTTNGFHLDFANSADIGNDISGNGNDWTPNNFTASDVVLDSPTDNHCTWNPLDVGVERDTLGAMSFSDGNLRVTTTEGVDGARGTIWVPTNSTKKYYFEIDLTSLVGKSGGISSAVDTKDNGPTGHTAEGGAGKTPTISFSDGALLYNNTDTASWSPTFSNGDILGVAINCNDSEVYFSKNGNWIDGSGGTTTFASAANAASSGLEDFVTPFISLGDNKGAVLRILEEHWDYTAPSGYVPISTANLPDPVIDPAQDASPEDYFNTVLYTGNGGTSRSITGMGFQADFLWHKDRSAARNHSLVDVIRGTNDVQSNATDAERSMPSFVSFDSDGFTVTQDGSTNPNWNENSITKVVWGWKANGSGVTNNAGSIPSTVSANTTSGFSVVKYTGNNTRGATIGHGLSQVPEFVAVKNLNDGVENWACFHKDLAGTFPSIKLNTLGPAVTSADGVVIRGSEFTSSVISVGENNTCNGTGNGHIAYCFHSVDGFSKFGSYQGNNLGGNDGPFVYLGFQPALVILKYTGSSNGWFMFDNAREPNNHKDQFIMADMDAFTTEFTQAARGIDFVSNGFKLRTDVAFDPNASGTYIYMAWAESPFKYSNAR